MCGTISENGKNDQTVTKCSQYGDEQKQNANDDSLMERHHYGINHGIDGGVYNIRGAIYHVHFRHFFENVLEGSLLHQKSVGNEKELLKIKSECPKPQSLNYFYLQNSLNALQGEYNLLIHS